MNNFLVILLLLVIIYFNIYKTEQFQQTNTANNAIIEFDLMKKNMSIFGDNVFDNVTGYINDDLNANPNALTGLDKCINQCNGYCVEYGLTGNAMCFPK